MEAMLLGFTAENSIRYSVVPTVIELSKEHAQDPAALDKLSMDRIITSYKLPELEANVLADQELDEFYMQMRKYIIANDLPQKTCRIDEWWGKMNDKDEFTVLKNGLCSFILFS